MLCFGKRPKHFVVYYSSSQQHCPGVVSVSSPETTGAGNIWQIECVVELGADCNYTVHVASRNEAGETNSTGTLSIS